MKKIEQYSFGPYGPFVALKDYKAALAEKDQQYDDLMAQAVKFAEYLVQGHRHRLLVLRIAKLKAGIVDAEAFLTSHAIQAWRARKEAS